MISTYASGSQTCVIGTEHFVSSPNIAGAYGFKVDLNAMAAGDILEVRMYAMAATGGTSRPIGSPVIYSGVQPADAKIVMPFETVLNDLADTNALRFSLKQTHGTGRAFPWGVMTLDAVAARAAVGLAAANLDTQLSKLDTLLARIGAWTGSGVNTILGAFKALLSKTASAPSDIGGTFDPANDSTEAIRDRGDAAWITATGFSTLTSGDVQTAATNALNAYDPPTKAEMDAAFALLNDLDSAAVAAAALSALASYDPPTKAELDAGLAALNDLDAAGVRTAVGLAAANLDTQLATLPTAAEIIDAYKAIGVDDLDMMQTIRVLLWCAIGNSSGLSNGFGTVTIKKRDGTTTCFTAAIDQHGNRTITIVDLS